jgi:hypothetical protein
LIFPRRLIDDYLAAVTKRLSADAVGARIPLIAAIVLFGFSACGDRQTEKREDASHVFIGTVDALHEDRGDGQVNYRVDIRIVLVEKGGGPKPGEVVPVTCYLAFPAPDIRSPKPKTGILGIGPRPGSYNGVPKQGERVRVYARKSDHTYKANYPDWYDIVN